MTNSAEKIRLHSKDHAIEVANFGVVLDIAIDKADMSRFEEQEPSLREHFPSISSPDVLQISLGTGQPEPHLPGIVKPKNLAIFDEDGKPRWTAAFRDNHIFVSCHKYNGWEHVWPEAEKRLGALISCLDPYKPIKSLEFSITDTFTANKNDHALTAKNIFKSNKLMLEKLTQLDDPRWDFSAGWFENIRAEDEILIRLEGRSEIRNMDVVSSISNLHSWRFRKEKRISDFSNISSSFDDMHDRNKELIRLVLRDDIKSRMGL